MRHTIKLSRDIVTASKPWCFTSKATASFSISSSSMTNVEATVLVMGQGKRSIECLAGVHKAFSFYQTYVSIDR